MSYKQRMWSTCQNSHESTSRPYSDIIPTPFDIRKHAQPHITLRIAWKHMDQFQKLQRKIRIWETRAPPRETRVSSGLAKPHKQAAGFGEPQASMVGAMSGPATTVPSLSTHLFGNSGKNKWFYGVIALEAVERSPNRSVNYEWRKYYPCQCRSQLLSWIATFWIN